MKAALDAQFGVGAWVGFEPETVSMEFGSNLTPLMTDKLCLLHILSTNPLQVLEDPLLFLYAAEVTNNNVADFSVVPHITLLEAAYAVISIKAILGGQSTLLTPPESFKRTVAYILNMEGCSEPIYPFEFIDASELTPGQTLSDTKAKKEAISIYTKHMDSL